MRTDPYLGHRFRVEIDGISEAGFSECSGLQAETEIEEYQEGGRNHARHKLPRGSKYANLTLRRGVTSSTALWDWYRKVLVESRVERRTVSVLLLDAVGEERLRWTFQRAYPVKWTGPDLKADGAAVAVQSLELAHDGITGVKAR